MNRIAILIINYNGYKDTCECIESIPKNDSNEIVVIDNASKEKEGEKIKERFPNIHLIQSNKNIGFAGANNLGIKYAINNKFDYVLLLNNDTIIEKDMIDELIKGEENDIITVPKMCYYSNPSVIWYAGGYIDRFKGDAKHLGLNEIEKKHNKIKYCNFATGCCMLINLALIKKIGYMNEEYFMYCEDVDYCIKMIENNIKIKYVPTAKLLHKVSSSTGGEMSPFSTYYYTRNRFLLIKNHNEFFFKTAFLYTLLTRKLRIFIYRNKKNTIYKYIEKAIQDSNKNISGKINL
ncbi:MAG: glycosyltransferase family 2 protein [Clostridia bacterium]|nr:glycosyltransferase family 2 protein [Clostridia bacterium]